jgi:benzodiazapine receptor
VPYWLLILIAMLVVGQAMNPKERDFTWYRSLQRPPWMSLHLWFPWAWFVINTTFFASTFLCWLSNLDWRWLVAYLALLIVIKSPPLIMCRFRSPAAGLPFWVFGWFFTLIMALQVRPTSMPASWLLLPALIWLPVEAVLTLEILRLNRR